MIKQNKFPDSKQDEFLFLYKGVSRTLSNIYYGAFYVAKYSIFDVFQGSQYTPAHEIFQYLEKKNLSKNDEIVRNYNSTKSFVVAI